MGSRSTFTASHCTATASGLFAICERLTHSACFITRVFSAAICAGAHAAETLLCSDDSDFSMASRLYLQRNGRVFEAIDAV